MRLGIYCAAHFLVDFSCALLVLGQAQTAAEGAAYLLVYNLFAFAVQMPLGLLADRLGKNHRTAAVGCLLAALAWLAAGTAAAVVAGLGNALFHVGGGLDTLGSSGRRAGPLGLFVSPGAWGVYLGTRWAGLAGGWPVCLALGLTAAVIWRRCSGPDNAPAAVPRLGGRLALALGCLLAVVVLRSWLGLAASFPWKPAVGPLAVLAVAGGKALGGLLADRLGMGPVAAGSLLLGAVCFLLPGPVWGLLGLCLFQMTMPLTLWAAARLLPGAKGFAFGLLTFGLFLGTLPTALGAEALGAAALALGTVAGLPLLLTGLSAVREEAGPC